MWLFFLICSICIYWHCIYPSLHNFAWSHSVLWDYSPFFTAVKISQGTSGDHPIPLPATAGCPGPCPVKFWYLWGWRLHNLSGKPVPLFEHTQCKKRSFLMLKWNFLCFGLYPLPLVQSRAPLSRRWLHLYCPHQVFIHKEKVPLSLLSRLNSPSSLSLSLCVRSSNPLIINSQINFTILNTFAQNASSHCSPFFL